MFDNSGLHPSGLKFADRHGKIGLSGFGADIFGFCKDKGAFWMTEVGENRRLKILFGFGWSDSKITSDGQHHRQHVRDTVLGIVAAKSA